MHFIHVFGKRMIEQRTDGLLRGQLMDRVMRGICMQHFIPLKETVLDRSPFFQGWVEGWMREKDIEWLKPKDWFVRGHNIVDGDGAVNFDGMDVPVHKVGVFILMWLVLRFRS